MKARVRVIFWVHALVAAYCITCGLLDESGHFQSWLIPHVCVFYALAASAFALPIVAAFSMPGSGQKHPLLLAGAHVAMGAAQLFFGLMPLLS